MEENKVIKEDATKSAAHQDTEIKATPSAPTYDPDEYMEDYYLYDDMFFYDDKCFSCKHWLEYDCGAPNGPCDYESY